MKLTNKLLTSVAAVALSTGVAWAQETKAPAAVEGGDVVAATPQATGEYPLGWNETLDNTYGDIADYRVAELVGMDVVTEAGDDVGEVDNFVIIENRLKAVVGVGGFLGMGEHEVALDMEELQYDGQRLIIAYTEEELKAMPEYTEEIEQIALREDDTFRTRGPMESAADQSSELAATQLETTEGTPTVDAETDTVANAEMAEGDDPATEEMAEAQEGEIEQEAEEIAAETENAVEGAAAETEQMAENAAEATEDAANNAGEAIANAAEATGDAVNDAAAATASWFDKLDAEFADIADWELNELEGRDVASANGEIIGEIDEIGMRGEKLVAIVGIGGFIGIGEHDVALDFDALTWDGEKFVAEGYTEAELKEMPEYTESDVLLLDDDTTLRTQAKM